jgi:hypothetical protein
VNGDAHVQAVRAFRGIAVVTPALFRDIPRRDIPRRDIPRRDIPRRDIPRRDIPRRDLA